MAWEVEFADEFGEWWESLTIEEQTSIDHYVHLLEQFGPNLKRPHADVIHGSKHSNMKELRVQHEGRPYRVLYAFDPRRAALLLIGGDKTGNNRWYEIFVPIADALFTQHLKEISEK